MAESSRASTATLLRGLSTRRPGLRAGTHNPWPLWLKKVVYPSAET
jgi:hypothetical protein